MVLNLSKEAYIVPTFASDPAGLPPMYSMLALSDEKVLSFMAIEEDGAAYCIPDVPLIFIFDSYKHSAPR